MYLKGIKKSDIEFVLECLRYGKYNYEERSQKYVYLPGEKPRYDKAYVEQIRNPTLDRYSDVMGKLRVACPSEHERKMKRKMKNKNKK